MVSAAAVPFVSAAPGLSTETLLTVTKGWKGEFPPGKMLSNRPMRVTKSSNTGANDRLRGKLIGHPDSRLDRCVRIDIGLRQARCKQAGAGCAASRCWNWQQEHAPGPSWGIR